MSNLSLRALACLRFALLGFVFPNLEGEIPPFSLAGPEVVRLDWSTRSLIAHDFNRDGRLDLAIINNDRAKIELLFQQNPNDPKPPVSHRQVRRNRWEPVIEDSRFLRESIVSGVYMYALAAGDLNGDGRLDIVYTGDKDPLTVRYQDSERAWNETWTYGSLEPLPWKTSLAVTDLNGDSRDDFAVLAKKKILLFYQDEKGFLSEPKTYRVAEENSLGLQILDINNDGRLDLFYLVGNNRRALRARFQYPEGGFGPELAFPLETRSSPIQPWTLDESGRLGFAHIQAKTHLLEIFSIEEDENPVISLKYLQPQTYTTGTSARDPALYALGDYNADGLTDLAVGDPHGARVFLYLQNSRGDFSEPTTFPSFANLSGIAAGDFEGSGQDTLVVLSKKEGILGLTRLSQSGRLNFPELLPIEGEPISVAAGDINSDGLAEILFVEKIEKAYRLTLFKPPAKAGVWSTHSIDLDDIQRDPQALAFIDLNSDERRDLAVLIPREAARLMLQQDDGIFSEVAIDSAIRKGLLTDLDLSDLGVGDVDSDGSEELIVAADGFARSLRLNAGGKLEIIDQYNARQDDGKIQGPLVLDLDRDGVNDILFFDRENESLQFLQRDAHGVFRYKKSVAVGQIDLITARVTRLSQGREPSLIFFGKDRFWVIPLDRKGWKLEVVASYETDLKDVQYTSLAAGDFNRDGVDEIITLDAKSHVLEILRGDLKKGWTSVLHFVLFEDNLHYQGRRGMPHEPREIVVADLTGDGRQDFALLMHDRVLLYYQE